MKKLKSKLAAISANKILDVGTGVGNFISKLELLKDYKKIVGIDNSREMLERAKNNFDKENIEFVLMDAENLNYEDNTFDMVSLSNSLHHLAEIDIVLNEMKRVLKSEGKFVVNEMFSDVQSEPKNTYVKLHHFGAKIDRILGDPHYETYTRRNIKQIIKNLDINIQDEFIYSHPSKELNQRETINNLCKSIDKKVEQIKDKEEYNEIKEKSKILKKEIFDVGLSIPDHIMIIGTK